MGREWDIVVRGLRGDGVVFSGYENGFFCLGVFFFLWESGSVLLPEWFVSHRVSGFFLLGRWFCSPCRNGFVLLKGVALYWLSWGILRVWMSRVISLWLVDCLEHI